MASIKPALAERETELKALIAELDDAIAKREASGIDAKESSKQVTKVSHEEKLDGVRKTIKFYFPVFERLSEI